MPSPTREIVVLIVESNAVARDHTGFITKPVKIGAELFAGHARGGLNQRTMRSRYRPAASDPLRDEGAMDADGGGEAFLPADGLDCSLHSGLLHDRTLAMLMLNVNSFARRL